VTVGSGIAPDLLTPRELATNRGRSMRALAGLPTLDALAAHRRCRLTAGGEFRPALKTHSFKNAGTMPARRSIHEARTRRAQAPRRVAGNRRRPARVRCRSRLLATRRQMRRMPRFFDDTHLQRGDGGKRGDPPNEHRDSGGQL